MTYLLYSTFANYNFTGITSPRSVSETLQFAVPIRFINKPKLFFPSALEAAVFLSNVRSANVAQLIISMQTQCDRKVN